MIGYGGKPPVANWPGGAKIAVQVVLNYEEGGENCLLHGDGASEAFLSEISGAQPYPGQRHWNTESIYEYGARAGFWRLHDMFSYLPVTLFGVASALARSPDQVKAMKEAGWEIASHGLKWIEHKDMSEDEERAQINEAIRIHREVTGDEPRGWYTGRCSMNTERLIAETGQFTYIADSYADDLPYWVEYGERKQLVVPYTMDCNDMRFAIQTGFTNGEQFEASLKDAFDVLYAEGAAGAPKMMSIGLHCRLIGRPSRAAALKRAIDYFRSHADVWFATRLEIAEHWMKEHPPVTSALRPSRMNKEQFVDAFGGIFERSPWIAEAAHGLELGPAHDTATGVHSALVRAFRSADEARRLEVLTAHADLAESGINALTDRERETFAALNETYTSRFGFPFVLAVKDDAKSGILKEFKARLENDRDTEFAEACRQVERIAEMRLEERFKT
ncbi:MAG: allantoinase PuuE [Hyphomicrobiales bacterium]|nr:allantoinase PuuE [Hyphomicrobiales bacterium]